MSQQPLKRSMLYPKHPERVCWGCARYCPAEEMKCGNGSVRTPHPIEMFGEDWLELEGAEANSAEDGSAGTG